MILLLLWALLVVALAIEEKSMHIRRFHVKEILDRSKLELKSYYFGKNIVIDNVTRTTSFSCGSLFQTTLDSQNLGVWPPLISPGRHMKAFTLDGKVDLIHWYMDFEKQNNGEGYVWMVDDVESIRLNDTCYEWNRFCLLSMAKYARYIVNKRGAVIGSQTPWAEAMLLEIGAKHITTIEYMEITTDHPQLSTKTPFSLAKEYLSLSQKQREEQYNYDFIFTFSSIEHDGLGRYGEPVNPYADLETVARIFCLLKPGGLLFLGMPTGYDMIFFNSHRIYGKYRMQLILSMQWEFIDILGATYSLDDVSKIGLTEQPIWILRKPMI